jgi:predicted 2-oxoglutarate/Fe(II)-dependent dioxygenase YbiX
MSGVLSFVNPTIMHAMHIDAGIARMQLPYGHQVASLSLEPGQLVIFPSWVLHEVKPFEGEGERITIAFNCWFTLPDAPGAK